LNRERSRQLFAEANKYIPGGVNSPARAFRAVGGSPLFIRRGKGPHIWDADGREYIDYVCSWGPLILGHAHPQVVRAIKRAAQEGSSFGAPTEGETTLARMIVEAVPSIELVRFVNSGTEATMSALRVARGFTGRDKVVKFQGAYHGHVDSLLGFAGSGAATHNIMESRGVPQSYVNETLIAPYNSVEAVKELFQRHQKEIAAVIVEPVAGNMGVVPPKPGFLEALRQVTSQHGALLIFDEVITGFRVAYGGAQSLYGVKPDLTCLGKIIGGGLPVGAYGGRSDVMQVVAPLGEVYQAGTLSGNPVAMAAGIETLKLLQAPGVYESLEAKTSSLEAGLRAAFESWEEGVCINRVGSLMTIFFTAREVTDYDSARTSNRDTFARFFHLMLDQNIYLPPSQFEAMFISKAHTRKDLERTIEAARKSARELRG